MGPEFCVLLAPILIHLAGAWRADLPVPEHYSVDELEQPEALLIIASEDLTHFETQSCNVYLGIQIMMMG